MKKILVLGLVFLGFSRVFAGWVAEVPDQWYFLLIDDKEKVKVDSCSEALSEAVIRLNSGSKEVVISARYRATAFVGCQGDTYTSASDAKRALKTLNQWMESHSK